MNGTFLSPFFPSAAALVSAAFGSNESTWDTPPVMKRKMTRFALPGKCGARGQWVADRFGEQLRKQRRKQGGTSQKKE